MDRDAWDAVVHGVAKSWTQLSDGTELNWMETNQNKIRLVLMKEIFTYWGCLAYTWLGLNFKLTSTVCLQFSSVTQSCLTLCDPMNRSTPGLPLHHQHPECTQTHLHWVGDAIQPYHPLSSPSPPGPIFPSIRVFSNESALHIRWPKYWSFSFKSVLPMNTQDLSPLG